MFLKGPLAGQELKPPPFKRLTFGRGDEADVKIPDARLSRVHFRLEHRGSSVFVEDMESTNGTRVNGADVKDARLQHGDVVAAGNTEFRFHMLDNVILGATTHFISPSSSGKPETVGKLAGQIIESLASDDRKGGSEAFFNKILYSIGNLTSREMDGPKMASSALDMLVLAFGAVRGVVFDRDLRPVAERPDSASCRGIADEPTGDLIREAIEHGVSLNRMASIAGKAPVWVCCAPLRGFDEIIGAIYLDADSESALPHDAASILALVGRHLGLALDRARLVREKFLHQERYRFLVEKATDCIFQLGVNGVFEFANPGTSAVFGVTPADATGKALTSFSPPELREGVHEKLDSLLLGCGAQHFEMEILRQDGSRATAALSVALLEDDTGRPSGIIGVGRDVTAERKIQEHVYQSERLASLGKLVAGVGHELNNPLTSVIGFSQLMLRDQSLSAPHRKRLEMILKEGERARTIVNNLLTFARPPRAPKAPVDLSAVMEQTATLMRNDIERSRTELLTFLEPVPPVLGDPSMMMEVFTNIILNAIQAISSAGKPGRLIVKTWAVEKTVHASMEDDGPGIPPEHLSRIFDPFFTTKPVGEGTGLGLSMCYRIIAGMGGTISVDSSPGAGATIHIELPAIT